MQFVGSPGGDVLVIMRRQFQQSVFQTAQCKSVQKTVENSVVVGFRAMLGSTVDTCSASAPGRLLDELHDFLRERVHSAPEVLLLPC